MIKSVPLCLNIPPPVPPAVAPIEGQGFGHRFKVLMQEIKTFFVDLFHAIGDIFSQRSPLGKVFKLSIGILSVAGRATGEAFHCDGLLKALTVADTVNDVGDIVADADHLINQRYKKEDKEHKKWPVVATAAFLVADVAGLFLWLNDLAIINLAKISAAIGRGFSKLASVLGSGFAKFTSSLKACPFMAKVLAKFTLMNVLRGIVAGAFLALAINEIKEFVNAIRKRDIQKVLGSIFYLASYVTEIALKILVIAGATNVLGLAVLGCLAAGYWLTGNIIDLVRTYRKERDKHFVIHVHRDREKEIAKEMPPVAITTDVLNQYKEKHRKEFKRDEEFILKAIRKYEEKLQKQHKKVYQPQVLAGAA